jgi:photosystem II stability/assembly factor-like uncharacterized protein
MKNLITIIILILAFFTQALSQPLPPNYKGWFFQNPLPTSNFLESVFFMNENTGFAVGGKNIIKTTNGGIDWYLDYQVIQQFYTSLRCVFFANNNTGYAAPEGIAGIFKTTNCGVNWSMINQDVSANRRSLFFTSPDTGYLVTGGIIKKTVNGAANWVDLHAGTSGFFTLYFLNSNTGYAVGGPGKIAKTTNAGLNWSLYSTGGMEAFIAVHFPTVDTGYVVSEGGFYQGELYRTTNAGLNWFMTPCPSGVVDIYFTNAVTGFITGFYTDKTTNGGATWFRILNIGGDDITFLNQFTGYVVGGGGTILHTTNAGENWHDQKKDMTGGNALYSVQFVNEITGYAGGTEGIIVKTTNAGNNWFRQETNISSRAIQAMQFLDEETGYAVGDSLLVLKTTNGGANWILLNPQVARTNFYALYFFDAATGYIAGAAAGKILKTTNGGSSWIVQLEEPFHIFTISFINHNTGYAAGQGLYRTTNAGSNWVLHYGLDSNFIGWIYKIKFLNSSTGYLVGHGLSGLDKIFKTTNSGVNWLKKTCYETVDAFSLDIADENTVYVCGWEGIMRTTNAGANWYLEYRFANSPLFDIDFINVSTGYAVGMTGTIIKTTTGGGVLFGIKQVSDNLPKGFKLYQNYPNPFNPSTKIKFEIPITTQSPLEGGRGVTVSLTIYDILGREVTTLVNGQLKPGLYEVEWSATGGGTNYASGVYFYRLQAGDYIETKKMVLVR